MRIDSSFEPRTVSMERAIRARESKGDSLDSRLNTFSSPEREEILNKLTGLMVENNLDGILLSDPDNFTYASGADLPYAEQYPHKVPFFFISRDGKKMAILCEPDWVDLIQDQGWKEEVITYRFEHIGSHTDLTNKIEGLLNSALPSDARVGVDDGLWSQALFEGIHTIGNYHWIPITALISDIRMIKTHGEIRQIEEACRHTDRAFVSALNHAEGNVHDPLGYDLWEFSERIRVHVGEFGGSGTGNVTCLQGEELSMLYKQPEGIFIKGNLLRAEITNHHRGYWSSGCRTFVVGESSEGQNECYQAYISLKNEAASFLKAGQKCSEIYANIKEYAEDEGIHLLSGSGLGHGIGVCEREAPFISPDDDTVLREGMVIVLTIYMQTSHDELVCSKDTYEISGDSPRLLNWYKNWDRLYRLVGNSARHG